ncbi:DinB/UmuC family translesion DNA polymerase [Streptomyces lunaelactis]|uniref:DinB/UmuC family translesion DNA polymerase n=1 Tax=Streptomyces lunaelactis TaxID=1535768 RepID=UPI0026D2A692
MLALAEQLGARLRKERQVSGRLSMTVRYADRSTTVRTRRLPEPTSHTAALARTAYENGVGTGSRAVA